MGSCEGRKGRRTGRLAHEAPGAEEAQPLWLFSSLALPAAGAPLWGLIRQSRRHRHSSNIIQARHCKCRRGGRADRTQPKGVGSQPCLNPVTLGGGSCLGKRIMGGGSCPGKRTMRGGSCLEKRIMGGGSCPGKRLMGGGPCPGKRLSKIFMKLTVTLTEEEDFNTLLTEEEWRRVPGR